MPLSLMSGRSSRHPEGGPPVRTTFTIPSDVMDELMEIVGTDDRTKAVEVAIREHVKHLKIQRLIALRGTVDIAENDEIESWDDVGIRDA